MAVSDQQKIDFLLKKIGFTKTKTGSTVGTGAISGTPKQPFAEALNSAASWTPHGKATLDQARHVLLGVGGPGEEGEV